LNKYEAQAYEALVRLGKSSAPRISRESGVPYGRIYDTLHSLVAKGLAKIIPEKAKKYAPGDPAKLADLLKKRQRELDKVQLGVEKLKEQYAETTEDAVFVAKGKRNFYTVTHDLPDAKQYSYQLKHTIEVRPEWVRNHRRLKSKGLDIKQLVRVDKDTIENIKTWKKFIPNIAMRKLSNDGVAMDITDKYVWIALIKSNTLLVVKDKSFIKMMKQLFLSSYKQAEKV